MDAVDAGETTGLEHLLNNKVCVVLLVSSSDYLLVGTLSMHKGNEGYPVWSELT